MALYRETVDLRLVHAPRSPVEALSVGRFIGGECRRRKNEKNGESYGYMTIIDALKNNVMRTLASVY
jgi:hypothetical protein